MSAPDKDVQLFLATKVANLLNDRRYKLLLDVKMKIRNGEPFDIECNVVKRHPNETVFVDITPICKFSNVHPLLCDDSSFGGVYSLNFIIDIKTYRTTYDPSGVSSGTGSFIVIDNDNRCFLFNTNNTTVFLNEDEARLYYEFL